MADLILWKLLIGHLLYYYHKKIITKILILILLFFIFLGDIHNSNIYLLQNELE